MLTFQSTHLREVRREAPDLHRRSLSRFNPRTYERCDIAHVRLVHQRDVSIHAPTRGATHDLLQYDPFLMFQSTHLREVRLCIIKIICTFAVCFNPRTYERCDQSSATSLTIRFPFQSTHLREVRQRRQRPMLHYLITFQSTHLREVRLHR